MDTKFSTCGKILAGIVILIIVSTGSFAYSDDGNGTCICSNCSDCNNALNDNNCNVVKLNESILDYNGTCINNPVNWINKIFDCEGYAIDGDGSGNYSNQIMGILLNGRSGNTIRNCTVTDFLAGFVIGYSSYTILVDNNVSSNDYGIYILDSSNNQIEYNIISENYYGIFAKISSSVVVNNIINSNERGIKIDDLYCSMNYDVTPDTVIFYHASWCGHCNNMKPWIAQLEAEGYNVHHAEYTDSSAMQVVNNCMPQITNDGFPHFGCTSNGKTHLGEFSSLAAMRTFSDECRNSVDRSSVINSNAVCSNSISDIEVTNSNGTSGDENTCNTGNWNDSGQLSGCDFLCSGCRKLERNLHLNSDTTLCSGVYNNASIVINSSDIIVDCNGASLNGSGAGTGIYIGNKNNVTVNNCNVMNYETGIYLNNSNSMNIRDNNASLNNHTGITIRNSNFNNLINNTANSGLVGIEISYSNNNTLTGNTASGSNDTGILLSYSLNNILSNNTAESNNYGIFLLNNSSFNNILNNEISNNNQTGIYLNYSSNNTLHENEISDNGVGIYSQNSSTAIFSNFVCNNWDSDLNSTDWYGGSGWSNACSTGNWNDTGSAGCFYTCKRLPRSCDFNNDKIIIHDYNDLMFAYKCFLGINKNCSKIHFQDWENMRQEYKCFVNNPFKLI